MKYPLILAVSAVIGLSGSLHAQFITLSTSFPSAISADVSLNGGTTTEATNEITSLPYATPATETITSLVEPFDSVTSTITPAVSSSDLDFGYAASSPDATSEASGLADIFFIADSNAAFSLTGSMALTAGAGEIHVFLADDTANHQLYSSDISPVGAGTTTLDSMGGSLTGNLTAGDLYEFKAFEGLSRVAAASLTGSVDLTFSPGPPETPEPSTYAMMLGGLALFGFCVRRKLV
jgi:hypothetical protein